MIHCFYVLDKQKLKSKKNTLKNTWTFEEIMYFLFFFDKQTKQCSRNRYSVILMKYGRVFFFLISILIITSWIYWLLLIYLCESSYFVSMHFLFSVRNIGSFLFYLFYFIIFCSFLWTVYRKYLSAKYVSKLVWICTACTAL